MIAGGRKPFGRLGEVFGDAVVAAAMIDRLAHHAKVVSMKGDSYRLRTVTSGGCLQTTLREQWTRPGGQFSTGGRGSVLGRC
jgi:hypothetical protein